MGASGDDGRLDTRLASESMAPRDRRSLPGVLPSPGPQSFQDAYCGERTAVGPGPGTGAQSQGGHSTLREPGILRLYLKFYLLFLAALGLCCCAQAFPGCSKQGLLFTEVRVFLTVVASLGVEHRL